METLAEETRGNKKVEQTGEIDQGKAQGKGKTKTETE